MLISGQLTMNPLAPNVVPPLAFLKDTADRIRSYVDDGRIGTTQRLLLQDQFDELTTAIADHESRPTPGRHEAQAVTVSLHNRRKLEVAIHCLLDGAVTPPDTKLTWKNVAAVAGVSKATADRAIDLRDEFRRQIEQRVPPPTTNPQPGSRSCGDADGELARLRQEHAELKESTKVLHSVILALVQENQRLARRRRRDKADVVALSTPDRG